MENPEALSSVHEQGTKDQDSNESLLMFYKHNTTEEERNQNALYLSLITLEPKNAKVHLNCPYGEEIGLPETVDILETSIQDLENMLSEMINTQISVFSRNPPDQYNHDGFSLPKEKVHLYSLVRSDERIALSLRVFRTMKVQIHVKCRKCGKDETIKKRVIVKDDLITIQDVIDPKISRISLQFLWIL